MGTSLLAVLVQQVRNQRQFDLLSALGLPTAVPSFDSDQLLDVMHRDKKAEHGRLRFVLPTRMGHVELVGNVDPEQARAALTVEGAG